MIKFTVVFRQYLNKWALIAEDEILQCGYLFAAKPKGKQLRCAKKKLRLALNPQWAGFSYVLRES